MGPWTRAFIAMLAALLATPLAAQFAADAAAPQEDDLAKRLLQAAEGLQMPGSEADSSWWFVSYPGEKELPTAERMASLEGCADYPESVMRRLDFDATFDSLARVQPWMDQGQKKSAHGFARLRDLFHRQYGEIRIYFLGLDREGLSGLKTINIET